MMTYWLQEKPVKIINPTNNGASAIPPKTQQKLQLVFLDISQLFCQPPKCTLKYQENSFQESNKESLSHSICFQKPLLKIQTENLVALQ